MTYIHETGLCFRHMLWLTLKSRFKLYPVKYHPNGVTGVCFCWLCNRDPHWRVRWKAPATTSKAPFL